ncbi:Acetolactate synthase-1/2/3 large subunit [Chelatococcus asaccharovorans]|nr:Acetolactate synthase-1/2/3 large subunit [Chelatococcus asaccharovorans]CAH1683697.1 Acetolactate synthase-1/2/3 large subunit [Chelatococcus asaccharovorans]
MQDMHRPTGANTSRNVARAIVDQLRIQGVERVTCVPGESYLAVLAALHGSGIRTITCRNEGGAAYMAEAEGKLTGRPGICFVTRGPGASNASGGVHVAMQDSTPMILFIGQIETGMREREAFQEVDYKAMFGSMAKWVAEIDDPSRVVEFVTRAFRVAMQGRPGPVVLVLPENVLPQITHAPDAARIEPARAAPRREDMTAFAALLGSARRPLAILGGSGWSEEACAGFADFAARAGLPVATSFRRAMLLPVDHPMHAGDLGIGAARHLSDAVREADLIALIGGRLSEMPSASYSLLEVPVPHQRLVHVHPGAEELGRVYQPELAIQAGPVEFVRALSDLEVPPAADPERAARLHAAARAHSTAPRKLPGRFQLGEAVRWLSERLPEDAIICNGAGNYAGWIHRHHDFRRYGTQLAPVCGTMGYGVPAAVMARLIHPDRPVIAWAGDGCFLMNGQELTTAVQYGAAIVVIVVDNGQYGTIRMHQTRDYPDGAEGLQMQSPDFAGLARACGAAAWRVETLEEFMAAMEEALVAGRPALLHCLLDPRVQSHAADFPEPTT